MRRWLTIAILLMATGTLGACACRPGYVAPNGVHPARCYVW